MASIDPLDVEFSESPVSIQLDAGESTTVPTGELWQVQLKVTPSDFESVSSDDTGVVTVDGANVLEVPDEGDMPDGGIKFLMPKVTHVVEAGKTIALEGGSGQPYATVSGFDVSDLVGYTVVQEFFDGGGDSVTVPSGEVWRVNISGGASDSSSPGSDTAGQILINDYPAVEWYDPSDGHTQPFDWGVFTLTGGDEVRSHFDDNNQGGWGMSGYKVVE